MHPPVTAEQKEAMRELRELQPPIFPRLAKIAGVHVTTVREIASRENWPKLHVPKGTIMQVARLKDLEAEEAARERAAALEALSDPEADVAPGDIGALVIEQMMAMLTEARRTGRIDKAWADGLWSTLRVAEHAVKFQIERVQDLDQEETRSDDELADILARVDERIVELARDYAERLGAEQLHAQAG
jgi:hypothetical protein